MVHSLAESAFLLPLFLGLYFEVLLFLFWDHGSVEIETQMTPPLGKLPTASGSL